MTKPSTSIVNVGTGLVGSEVLDQLLALPQYLDKFDILGIASSKSVKLYDNASVQRSNWRQAFNQTETGQTIDKDKLILHLKSYATQNQGKVALFIDNTASEDIAKLYPELLRSGVSVVTPNKKAYSSDLKLYKNIVSAAKEGGSRYFLESTVGAGLPIISTLKDLVATGDTVTKIEGVFSGTLSYLFNVFSTTTRGGPTFSSTVAIAREKGYTEPNPAEDLSGSDVARKLTILSRLIPELTDALPHGYKSVDTKSISPAVLDAITNGDEYIKALPAHDSEFDVLREEALKEGKVLRYVGVVDVKNRIIRASLEKYDVTHPFATSLGGSDNIIMFHTARYNARPLIIQGAGAGAAVTAMGVVSDVLKFLETRP